MPKFYQIQSWPTPEIFIRNRSQPNFIDSFSVGLFLSFAAVVFPIIAPAQADNYNAAISLSSATVPTNPLAAANDGFNAAMSLSFATIIMPTVAPVSDNFNAAVSLTSATIIQPNVSANSQDYNVGIILTGSI